MSTQPVSASAGNRPDPQLIFETATGFMRAKHLFVAGELGVFESLAGGPKPLDELARVTGAPQRTVRIIVDGVWMQSPRWDFSSAKATAIETACGSGVLERPRTGGHASVHPVLEPPQLAPSTHAGGFGPAGPRDIRRIQTLRRTSRRFFGGSGGFFRGPCISLGGDLRFQPTPPRPGSGRRHRLISARHFERHAGVESTLYELRVRDAARRGARLLLLDLWMNTAHTEPLFCRSDGRESFWLLAATAMSTASSKFARG